MTTHVSSSSSEVVAISGTSQERYFRVLLACVFASLFLLVGTQAVVTRFRETVPLWAPVIPGVAPLVYYHLVYLAPRARTGLSQSAIDSVYYFGFLVTVMALGISAVSIAFSGVRENLSTVIYQFGIGLFATAYAVVARMHLSSISRMLDDASPEALIDRYIQRSRELVGNADMAAMSFIEIGRKSAAAIEELDRLSSVIVQKTEETAGRAQVLAVRTVQDAARAFSDEMKSTLALTREALLQVRGMISDTSFVAEREQLARSIKATIDATTKLNQSLSAMSGASGAAAQATQQATAASDTLTSTLIGMHERLSSLGASDGPFASAAKEVVAAADALNAGTKQIAMAATHLSDLTRDVEHTVSSHRKLSNLAKKIEEQLVRLGGVSEEFAKVLPKLSTSAAGSREFADEMQRVASAFPELSERVTQLTEALGRTVSTTDALQDYVSRLPSSLERANDVTGAVVALLDQVRGSVQKIASDAAALSANTASAAASVAAAERLLGAAEHLDATLTSIGDTLSQLPGSMQAVEHALAESARQVRETVSISAQALEEDVQRSAAAARLLTTKLAEVAQGIIDRTRAHQGAAS